LGRLTLLIRPVYYLSKKEVMEVPSQKPKLSSKKQGS
jgi:hypothetical protein